jgi:pimeloyl-ACP methyl ester carboxylesterase/tellurite resistance protein
MEPSLSPVDRVRNASEAANVQLQQSDLLRRAAMSHAERIGRTHQALSENALNKAKAIAETMSAPAFNGRMVEQMLDYLTDAGQRMALTIDVLRERAANDAAHEAAGTPPILIYESETVVDGRTLRRPVNYMLLKILPPEGVEILDWKRPYMIIDPRAGHGAGIGGSKQDSQVGVALADGHPVYFVAFRPHPEPGQALADVMRAEAEFVKEIARRHPKSPKPIIVGNCQGGWAAMILAAANPDISGPLIINGAPLSYWSGRVGETPLRYRGGLSGGLAPALFLADLGHGEFDGAHLVANFESLNPARHVWTKYYELYRNVDTDRERFLEFERWWGGYHFMTEAEIRWIVEQLFIGNRLARGEARIERGRQIDLKQIRSPIIVFTSYGDAITPPQQALNWIPDTYADENEIKIRGQRIVYLIHENVGHLGIFVSSSVARREHSEVGSTMKTIEALSPGLYEMRIEDQQGEGVHARFRVSFEERRLGDVAAIDDGRQEDSPFAALNRLSELGAELYDLCLRPLVQSMVTPQSAAALRDMNAVRLKRSVFSDRNPAMSAVGSSARQARAERKAAPADNVFRQAEALWVDLVTQTIDFQRDLRDAWSEWAFYALYASPLMEWVGRSHNFQRTLKDPAELRWLPEVRAMLRDIARGGFPEAVIRMLIVMAEARGSVRRSRLERSAHVLSHDEPFASLGAERRAELIHEQSVIVKFEMERAIDALADLLPDEDERQKAIGVVEFIAGALEEMDPQTIHALQRFRRVLGLPPLEFRAAVAAPPASLERIVV